MDNPLISVIIPAYNMADYLPDTIQSVLDQSYKNTEIIVIDDGSTDNTQEVIKRFKQDVSYYYQDNSGPSASRNRGLEIAKGKYVAFLDADDLWLPNKLEMQVSNILSDPNIGIVGCGYSISDADGKTIRLNVVRKNYKNHEKLLMALSIYQIIPGSSSGVLIPKECFEKVGVFDVSLKIGEDWDMWLRIAKEYKVVFVEDVLVIIRKNIAKPKYRTATNEEKYVTMLIEKSVPLKYKKRAYAALYGYLGSMYLTMLQRKLARSYLARSIKKHPFFVFPMDITNEYDFPKVSRYYLLLKSIFRI